jgi:dTMP kinase
MFIVFEGMDGSGKSTQLELAARWLRAAGRDVVTCREPGSTRLGEEVRELVLHRRELAIDPYSEMLLFMVARCQLVREIIQPALHRNCWVLCDRFQLSTAVYQGHAGTVDLESIRRVGEVATAGLVPDQVFLLDLDPDIAWGRLGQQLDRLESRGRDYLAAVHAGFRLEASRCGAALSVIDANRPVEEIARDIAATLATRFSEHLASQG